MQQFDLFILFSSVCRFYHLMVIERFVLQIGVKFHAIHPFYIIHLSVSDRSERIDCKIHQTENRKNEKQETSKLANMTIWEWLQDHTDGFKCLFYCLNIKKWINKAMSGDMVTFINDRN